MGISHSKWNQEEDDRFCFANKLCCMSNERSELSDTVRGVSEVTEREEDSCQLRSAVNNHHSSLTRPHTHIINTHTCTLPPLGGSACNWSSGSVLWSAANTTDSVTDHLTHTHTHIHTHRETVRPVSGAHRQIPECNSRRCVLTMSGHCYSLWRAVTVTVIPGLCNQISSMKKSADKSPPDIFVSQPKLQKICVKSSAFHRGHEYTWQFHVIHLLQVIVRRWTKSNPARWLSPRG